MLSKADKHIENYGLVLKRYAVRWIRSDKVILNSPFSILHFQLTSGMVKVNSVFPSRLATEMFSPWEQTRVLTM